MLKSLPVLLLLLALPAKAAPTLNALIIDGQNNHKVWPKTTAMMKQYLEETGLFSVDVKRTAFTWRGEKLLASYPLLGVTTVATKKPRVDPDYQPKFSKYDVVISNFGWKAAKWPRATQIAFANYVKNGGGFVVVHAANNAFPGWPEFNEITGLGGWGNRTESHGPYVYLNDAGKLIRDDSPGKAGSHGPQHEFQITVQNRSHPITNNMPALWLHTKDECHAELRGPAKNLEILATAYSNPAYKGTGRHEPALFTIGYGKGRVFHITLGHSDTAMESVGFIASFTRGAEWAATGAVTQKIPEDFPGATQTRNRSFNKPTILKTD